METFSGGQQSRVMLAKLLLAAPDVMLLDEPSNHLDIQRTQWLESYLSQQNEAMLIVSHDRAFLDKVCTKIFELHQKRLAVFTGNYTAYVRQREERYLLALKTWEAQQEYIAKQEEYIRRANYGQLAKQAQSRQNTLDKLERVEKPVRISGPAMDFQPVRRSGDVVFEVQDLAKGFDRPLFEGLSFQVQRGQRLGIMGPNGSGKTTLLRVLLGDLTPDAGEVRRGHLTDVGYFDQHLSTLPANAEAIRAAWPANDKDMTEQPMRNLLGRFGIMGDQVYQKVGSMSGGERSRVALAKLVALKVNVLVLDEPTNHLDLWACEALEEALRAFDGTVIVVSHDRYFLNRVADLLVVFEPDGRVRVIYGNYDTYELMKAADPGPKARAEAPRAKAEKAEARPAEAKPAKRKRRFPYRKAEDIEADIATLEARVQQLEAELASPELYRDGERVKQVLAQVDETKAKLGPLYEHWEEALELNKG
jgi:ATP-binding cassette subfamily F protein 3